MRQPESDRGSGIGRLPCCSEPGNAVDKRDSKQGASRNGREGPLPHEAVHRHECAGRLPKALRTFTWSGCDRNRSSAHLSASSPRCCCHMANARCALAWTVKSLGGVWNAIALRKAASASAWRRPELEGGCRHEHRDFPVACLPLSKRLASHPCSVDCTISVAVAVMAPRRSNPVSTPPSKP
jgi:hypothetical protein